MKPQEPDQLDYLSQHIETLEKENELFARQLTVRNEDIRILKQTIKNLEAGHQKELTEARARIEKLERVRRAAEARYDTWTRETALELVAALKACEEKEPT